MKASEIIADLPELPTPDREAKIVNLIGLGNYISPTMVQIESKENGHTAIISVMSDALMIGEPDDFLRINATMIGEQHIADMLQMSLLTSKVADLIRFNARVAIEPCTQTADSRMAYTSRMVQHSEAVNKAIVAATGADKATIASGQLGIVADVGKDWVLSNSLAGKEELAANYGWHTKLKPNPASPQNGPFRCQGGGYMWQTLGTRHNTKHVDYSQVVRLMSADLIVDGTPMKLANVAADPVLCRLISYEAPLVVLRHPESATIDYIVNA